MGVSIYAANSKYSFDCGYGGFYNLRKNVALALDEEFGHLYEKILYCRTKEDYDVFDRASTRMAARKKLDCDVLDFLFQTDAGGSVSYKTCKKIYDLIKDVDYGKKGFRYANYRHNDYEEFKEFLLECWKHRRKMRWY